MEHLLHVQREEEEHREDGGAEQEPDHVRACERSVPEDPQRHQRRLGARLDHEEDGDQRCGSEQEADRRSRSPVMLVGRHDRIDEQRQTRGDGDGSGDVEPPVAEVGTRLLQQHRREHHRRRADRHVDEEDPRPAEVARQHSAREDADCRAGAGDRAPDAERRVPLLALGEGRREDREGGGRDDRGAESLHGAGRDQRSLRVREPAGERGDREQRHADDEQLPPAKQVRDAAAEQQEPAERKGVCRDHPLQVRLREVEVRLDRRERDVHDRDVDDDHEGCDGQKREREPLAVRRVRGHPD